jgi:transcriptional regulator with XRE-family HTH domain
MAQNPLREELPRILSEQGVSIRELARRVGISDAHLSRVLAGRKTTSADLARRIEDALGLRAGFFIEDREGAVIDAIKADPALRDRLYRRLS